MQTKPILYMVLPCYNEEEALPISSKEILALIQAMIDEGEISGQSRILLVDDGSKDKTWPLIQSMHEQNELFSGVKLAGNRGHQYALLAGLMTAREYCDISISIDADLQDDINVIRDMVREYKNGAQVVYGVRSARDTDTFFKRFTAQSYYKLLKHMGVDIVFDHADYRLLSKAALDALAEHKEVNLFLRGLVPVIGYQSATVYYERSERVAGESKYPLKKMLALAWQGITSFSFKPIHLIISGGVVFMVAGLLILLGYAVFSSVTTLVAVLSSLWFVTGILMVSIGIVGEYVGKTYLEAKQRPRYIIERILNQ